MAVKETYTLDDFTRQPDDQEGLTNEGKATHSIAYKGEYSQLKTFARTLEIGQFIESNNYLESWNLRRVPGDLGVLTLNCVVSEESKVGGESGGSGGTYEPEPTLLKDVWTCRSIRNDVSILAYCGGEGYADRALVEAWQKEPDGKLASENKYRNSAGKIEEIKDQATLDVIDKIRRGVESVMRFYPLITRTRTYDREPEILYEKLNKVDTPKVPPHFKDKALSERQRKVRVPRGLAAIVNNATWLKCQDDIVENPDGKWIRTESWMGIFTWSARDAWDPELYGDKPWSMPHKKDEGSDFGTQTGDSGK